MQQASINIVLAAGMTFVILTGGIDLSVGSVLAVSAVVAVSHVARGGVALWRSRWPAGRARARRCQRQPDRVLPPAAFIVTLGAMTAVRALSRLAANDTTVFKPRCSSPGSATPTLRRPLAGRDRTAGGRGELVRPAPDSAGVWIYGVGGNPDAARLSGIKVWAVLMFVYMMSGLLAGLGGIMSAARTFSANGAQLGMGYELDAIAAVILGGTSFVGGIGTIFGTLVGALIIAVLSNGLILMNVSEIWQFIIKGLVIIGAVALDRYRLQGSART